MRPFGQGENRCQLGRLYWLTAKYPALLSRARHAMGESARVTFYVLEQDPNRKGFCERACLIGPTDGKAVPRMEGEVSYP